MVANTPGPEEALASDWRKPAKFYRQFGGTEAMLRDGVVAGEAGEDCRTDET